MHQPLLPLFHSIVSHLCKIRQAFGTKLLSILIASTSALSLSGCLEGHQDAASTASAASGKLTVVSYDTSTANLNAQGSINYTGITGSTVVQFHLSATCGDLPIGQGTEQSFSTSGITLKVSSTATSPIYVAAIGLPTCQLFATYSPAYTAPAPPSFVSISPASPSRVSWTPSITGTTSNTGSTVSFYSDSSCKTLLASGSGSAFSTVGISLTLQPNHTTQIYAQATEPFGHVSSCALLTSYTHSNSGPAAPTYTSTNPVSPSNQSSTPTLVGTVDSTSASVTVFSDPACSTQIGSGTAALFTTTGLQLTVPQNASTTLYAVAYDKSNAPSVCAYMTTFVNDSIGPASGPSFYAAVPASPTNASIYPAVMGFSTSDTVQIKLFSGAACATQIGVGTKGAFENHTAGGGINAAITPNAITLIYAAAYDAAGNQSACTFLVAYTHNSISPDPPVFDSTSPSSPNNKSIKPLILGFTSPAVMSLLFFNDQNCTNNITDSSATPSASNFSSPGIMIDVTANATTTVYAQSVDIEGNRSACTLMVNYMHSTASPPTATFVSANPGTALNVANPPYITGTTSNSNYTPYIIGSVSTIVSTVTLYSDSICSISMNSGNRSQFTTSGIQVTVPNNRISTIYATTTDVYGNSSACTFLTNFVYDTKTPVAPVFSNFDPVTPTRTSTTPNLFASITPDPSNVLPVVKVVFYDSLLCLNSLGSGTPASMQSTGIPLSLPGNTTTTIYAKSYDAAGNFSACTYMSSFTNDTYTPGIPIFSATLPASPSYTQVTQITGTVGKSKDFLGLASIAIYSDSLCQNILGSTTQPSTFSTTGITVTAFENQTTSFYGVTTDIVGNSSACTALSTYVHNDIGPTNLVATQNLDGTVSLVWQPDMTARPTAQYVVKRSLVSGGPYTVLAWTNAGNNFTDTSITNGATYYYTVAATNNTGTSYNSIEAPLTVSIATPAGVGTTPPLTALPSNGQIILTWSGFANDASFKVYRATQTGGPYTLLIGDLNSKTYTDLTVTNGTPYYYVVTGTNPAGDSQQSTEASAVPLNGTTSATNLKIAEYWNGYSTCVVLTWTAPSYYTTFFVNRGGNSGGESTITTTTANTYTDCNPYSDNPYRSYYNVVATWGNLLAAPSNEVVYEYEAPASLTVYPGNSVVQLVWTPVTNATTYNVYRATQSGGPYTTSWTNLGVTSMTDSTVTNGVGYYYIVVANFSTGGTTVPSNEQSGIPGANPTAPTNLIVLNDSTRFPRLSWTPPANFNNFNVYESTSAGGTYTLVPGGTLLTNPTFLDTSALNQRTYYKVTAVWGNTETTASNIVSYRHGYPTTFTATAGAANIVLNWTAVTSATSYTVLRGTSSGAESLTVGSPATNTFTDTTAAAATGYFYTVQANFADGTSGEVSTEVSAMLTGTTVPSGVTVTSTTQSSVSLAWAKVNSATSYKIYKSTTLAGTYSLVSSVNVTNGTISTGLVALSTYYFKVTAVVGSESAKSTAVAATLNGAPSAPSGIPGNNSISLSWSNVLGATSYILQRSTNGVNFAQVGSPLSGSDLPYTDTVANGTLYFYRYISSFSTGPAVTSAVSGGITSGTIAPVPAGLSIVASSSTSLTLNWAVDSGATGYNVYVSNASGVYGTATIQNGNPPSVISSYNVGASSYPLVAGTTYYMKVTSLNGTVESATSSEISAIPFSQPLAPTATAQGLNSQISVQWGGVAAATSYDLQSSLDGVNFTTIYPGLTTTSQTDTTVVTGLSYVYRYQSYIGALPLGYSAVSSPPIMPGIAPQTPTQLAGELTGTTTATLNWVQSPNVGSNFDGRTYNVYRGTAAGVYSYISNLNGSSSPPTTYVDSALANNTTYYYVVRAVNNSGVESGNSNVVALTTGGAPASLVATPTGNTIVVSWPNTGAASYLLRKGTSSGGPYGVVSSGSASTSFTDTNVQNGVTYYYVFNTVTAGGSVSPDSNEASATASVTMNLEVPIELTDAGLLSDVSPITFARTMTSLTPSAYDGTVTYFFEISATNTNSVAQTVSVVNSSATAVATISVPAGTTTLTRFVSPMTPTGSDIYSVQLSATTSTQQLQVSAARIIVKQIGASKTKVYIPLLSANSPATNVDQGNAIEYTMSNSYTSLNSAAIWNRNSTAFSSMPDQNAWELEALVSVGSGVTGVVGLFDKTFGNNIVDTESVVTSNQIAFTHAVFSEGIAGFSTTNDGDDYQVGIKCLSGCPGASVAIYKAGLWVNITSLNNVEVFYRTSHGATVATNNYVDGERTRPLLSSFSNPTAYFQATGYESSQDTAAVSLYSLGTNETGYAGAAGIANSTLNFSQAFPIRLRSSAITLTTGLRYLPAVNPTSVSFNLTDSFIVIDAHR